MTEATAPLPAGTRLAHYEVIRVLGTGGMGTVYLAHDTALDREVAVKVLRPEVAGDAALRDRFVREARAAARVSHPNLTHVYFVGEADGRPYFALEDCPGTPLEAAIRDKGPFPLERGLDVLEQAARGLAAAHGAGVVHRDVKPSNLMVLPDGRVKVTDFGLAKSLSGDVGATAGRILGTPTYMSPEQVRGKPVDARTDIYLLGLTAWFLFAGRPPFASEQIGEVIHDQMNSPLPPLAGARPDLPPALGEALERMCAKDPSGRFASMDEVAALAASLRPRPLLAAPLLARGAASAVDALLVLLGWGAVGLSLVFLLKQAGVESPEEESGAGAAFGAAEILERAAFAAILVAVTLWFEVSRGTTPGKVAFHLKVVRPDGNRPSRRAMLVRFLAKYPGILWILVPPGMTRVQAVLWCAQGLAWLGGGLWYFFADGRTLPDVLSRTRVVHRGPGDGVRVP